MRGWLRVAAMGAIVACGGDDGGGGPVPRAGEPCSDGSAARCGRPMGSSDALDRVLACDGGAWTQLVACNDGEECHDDASRGAVICSSFTDEIAFGEFDGPCEVAGAEACSTDRHYAMRCTDGSWAIADNCSTDVLECALVDDAIVCQ